MNLKTASKSRVFLSTDRCSLPESKRSVVIVSLYVDLRCKYIPAYYRQKPNMFKIIELLRTENTYTLKRLSTF